MNQGAEENALTATEPLTAEPPSPPQGQELKDNQWQLLATQEITKPPSPVRLRVSSSGQCERALVYVAQGLPETDPPDQAARNRMALGHMAEILIILHLHQEGWETKYTVVDGGQLTVEVPIPGTGLVLRGHPDGLCRHSDYTRGHWVTLECKSMSSAMAGRVTAEGVAQVYPKYINQISLYALKLHQKKLVSHAHKGVFAMMDRNGDPMPPERTTWAEDHAQKTIDGLRLALQRAEANAIPPRPYPPDSFDCRYCNYHTLCRGPRTLQEEPDGPYKTGTQAADEDILEAARTWLSMDPELKRVKRILQDASDDQGKLDIFAGEVTAGYFQPRQPPAYDPALLLQKVPADILRQCLSPFQDKREGFWIRRTR